MGNNLYVSCCMIVSMWYIFVFILLRFIQFSFMVDIPGKSIMLIGMLFVKNDLPVLLGTNPLRFGQSIDPIVYSI